MHALSSRLLIVCLVALFAAVPEASTHAQNTADTAATTQRSPLFETVQQTDGLATFVSTLRAAERTDLLKRERPLTVFAPTDSAFAALPESTFAPLLRPENTSALRSLVEYHVVEGRVTAEDLRSTATLTTIQGAKIKVDTTKAPALRSNGTRAAVTTTDLPASNGILHIIDAVLMPPTNTASRTK